MSRTVYIPVEIKSRELYGKMILASYFIKNGLEVVIGEHGYVRDCALKSRNGIYIEKDMYHIRAKLFKELKKRDFYIVAWDEEGLVTSGATKFTSYQLDKESMELCDLLITWGDFQREKMIEYAPEIAYKTISLGNPRLDLLRKDSELIYRDKVNKLRRKYGSFILINSNFDLITNPHAFKDAKRALQTHQEDYKACLDHLKSVMNAERKIFPFFVNAIERLAQKTDYTIIIRPHPNEDGKIWKAKFGSYKNVKITKKYDANTWIKAASLIVHNTCTTGIESYLGRTPVITLEPNHENRFSNELTNLISRSVVTNEELVEVVNKLMNPDSRKEMIVTEFFTSQKDKLLDKYICFDKKKSCSERIAKEILKNSEKKVKDAKPYLYNQQIKKPFLYETEMFMRQLETLYRIKHAKSRLKYDLTTSREFKRTFEAICHMCNVNTNISIDLINYNTFHIGFRY